MARLYLFIISCLLAAVHCRAASYGYDHNEACSKAYRAYLSLHIQEGHALIETERKSDPYNLMAVYIADYEDCILLLLNCDKALYDERAPNFNERLALLEKGDRSSPWYRFCRAGIYLHKAIINIRFGEQYEAALNFHRSFALLKENERLFPSFEYNRAINGLEEAVAGSLPGSYKWLAGVLGMKGDVKKGTAKLAGFVNSHNASQPLYAEAVLYYIYARFYLLAEQGEVWNFLNSAAFSTANDLLHVFVKVNIALDHRRSDAAIATLRTVDAEAYRLYPVLDHMYGAALLTRLDTACISHCAQYLRNNKSDLYIKDSWQKMAFAWFVNNDRPNAIHCMDQIKANGTTRIDADKQAGRFAANGTWPPVFLLQARLLIEGGYYDRALHILQAIDQGTLTDPASKAEYHFRLGRVYEELAAQQAGRQYYQQALAQYRTAITAGAGRHEQFAARAALHMGKVYEALGLDAEAINKYNECLDMPSHDFQNSIDQQAKAGINRIENR